MVQLRASSISLLAFFIALLPAAAFAQAATPTTAYNMNGVATSLTEREESAISSRLRTLRNTDMLGTIKLSPRARQQMIVPMQDSDEALHDMRTGTKASKISNPHSTQSSLRVTSPALYKDVQTREKPSNPTAVERTYNESMRLSGIGAGSANATVREPEAPKRRVVPNMADRVSKQFFEFSGDLAGQGRINETVENGMPRRTLVMARESDRKAAGNYRGQPLSNLASYNQEIAVPTRASSYSPVAAQPMSLSAAPASQSVDPYNVPPPVIYGPGDAIPPAPGANSAPQAAADPVQENFQYKKIDQSSGMTTPRLGSPTSSRSSVRIQQPNNYAMTTPQSDFNFKGYVKPRSPTEAGSLLWTENDQNTTPTETMQQPQAPAQERMDDNEPLLAQTPTYGSRAVPLSGSGVGADRRWGFFVTGNTGFGEDQHEGSATKANTTTASVTAGLDYRLKDKTFVGMALTYAHSSFTTNKTSDLLGNSFSVSLYGTSDYATNAYVDSYLSLGYHAMTSERMATATQKAKANPDGFQITSRTETGYDIKNDGFKFGPYAAFRFSYADFGNYTEKGSPLYNLKVNGQDSISAITTLGVGGSHRFAMSNGGALLPGMRMAYNHEFGDDHLSVKSELAGSGASRITTDSAKKSRDWLSLSPSLTAALANDWTVVAQYEHDFFRDDVNENIFNLAAHYKW